MKREKKTTTKSPLTIWKFWNAQADKDAPLSSKAFFLAPSGNSNWNWRVSAAPWRITLDRWHCGAMRLCRRRPRRKSKEAFTLQNNRPLVQESIFGSMRWDEMRWDVAVAPRAEQCHFEDGITVDRLSHQIIDFIARFHKSITQVIPASSFTEIDNSLAAYNSFDRRSSCDLMQINCTTKMMEKMKTKNFPSIIIVRVVTVVTVSASHCNRRENSFNLLESSRASDFQSHFQSVSWW